MPWQSGREIFSKYTSQLDPLKIPETAKALQSKIKARSEGPTRPAGPERSEIFVFAQRAAKTSEYINSWNMSYSQGNVVKYVTRYDLKHEDLRKQREDLAGYFLIYLLQL